MAWVAVHENGYEGLVINLQEVANYIFGMMK